jgi:3-oxoacyl-[acyl-carrier protein] reductase
MTDRYQSFTSSPIGQLLVKNLGLPNPVRLERYSAGGPLVEGTVVVGGSGRLVDVATTALDGLGIASTAVAAEGEKYKGIVFDATGITSAEGLVAVQQFFTPLLRSLKPCAHVVVLGTNPSQTGSAQERVAQRALEGITRSLGKEIGRGSTVNLVYVAPGAESTLESTLAFFLSPKSAYVSGQVARLGLTGTTTSAPVPDPTRPLEGKVAVVTGASRGIGEQIARVLHRDGATVVGIDVPQAASELVSLMAELDGDQLTLDIPR